MFMLIFAALVVVSGPNIIEKIFGMDIGLTNELFKLAMVARVGFGAVGLAGRAMSGLGAAGAAAGSFLGKSSKSGWGPIPDDGNIKNNNPNQNRIGETKEPNVNPDGGKTGPYQNTSQPNQTSSSGASSSQSSRGNEGYTAHHTPPGTNSTFGTGSTEITPNHPSGGGGHAFTQDVKEPNQDIANAGLSKTTPEGSSDSHLQHDLSQGSNGQSMNNSSNEITANKQDLGNGRGEHTTSAGAGRSTGSIDQSEAARADDTRMGRTASSGMGTTTPSGASGATFNTRMIRPDKINVCLNYPSRIKGI